jgi:hypothetical protein
VANEELTVCKLEEELVPVATQADVNKHAKIRKAGLKEVTICIADDLVLD